MVLVYSMATLTVCHEGLALVLLAAEADLARVQSEGIFSTDRDT